MAAVFAAIVALYAFAGAWDVHAASNIAKVTVHGEGTKTYSSFESMVDYVEDCDDETITIEMLRDWNAAAGSDFDRRLIIPEDSTVILNMHGHVFSRNNSWNSGDQCQNGELIKVEANASLTINGGAAEAEKNTEHKQIPVHTSTAANATANGRTTICGGLLCGGASTNGAGGIHADHDSTIVLNDVTIAGCRSHNNHVSAFSGNGGGIFLRGAGQVVRMKNSRITGCAAACKGGGIYTKWFVELNYTHTIEMVNSSIDHNYASESGGGIYLGSDNTYVLGSNSSEISYNQSAENGGGIYEDQEDTAVSGLTLKGNKAVKGGGVYTNDTKVSLSNLVVTGNSAERGGGIFISHDKNTISCCEVTGNTASASGGGVYVDSGVDEKFNVTGKVIVRDNKAGWGNNFYMSDDDPEDNRVRFNLTSGSDVRVYYWQTKNKDTIMVTEGKGGDMIKSPDCTRFLTAENSGYCFDFRSEPNMRKIVFKKGKREADPAPTKVSADKAVPSDAGTVSAGGGKGSEFKLIRGFITHQKTDSSTGDEDRNAVFYYSDGLFYGGDDPQYSYNEHLATLSLNMAFSAMYLEANAAEVEGDVYYNKHAAGRQFLADIGCPDESIYVNDSMARKPETDSIGVIIGSKKLQKIGKDGKPEDTGDILIPVTFRGGGYEKEWASNVTLGTATEMSPSKEAKGFANAADQAIEVINLYLDNYGLRQAYEEGRVKFWLAGYSRAGATTNLTSKRLVDQISEDCQGKKSQVFAYTCEAPKGGTDEAEKAGSNYECIHNMINTADVVPLVAPEKMGFKRYGVDHYIPGDAAGAVKATSKTVTRGGKNGVTKVTTKRDNTAMRTKGAKEGDAESRAYVAARDKMTAQLALLDSEIVFDDYFHPMYLSFPFLDIEETGSYDNTRVEDFLEDFLTFFMEGMNYQIADHWSQAVCNRDRWLEPWGMNGKYYSTIQDSLRDTMCLVFGMPSSEMGSFTSRASTITGHINTASFSGVDMVDIYKDVIGDWHEQSPATKEKYTTSLWNSLVRTGALEFLDETQKANLQKDWPTILGFLLHFTDGDYAFEPGEYDKSWASGSDESMMYLATFATFAGYILSNHYPEINLAWARTYDDWYSGESREYSVTPPSKVADVSVYDKNGKKLQWYGGAPNVLTGDQKIRLENEEVNGEAIYYDLYETTAGNRITKTLATNRIYRGGVDLALGDEALKYYRLSTYNMSHGVAGDRHSYRITLRNDRHLVIFETRGADGNDKTIEGRYAEGQQLTTQAGVADDQFFEYWKVSLLREDGSVKKEDITERILGENANKPNAVFTMPVVNLMEDSTFEDGYILKFQASYGDRIKTAMLHETSGAPMSGEVLPARVGFVFDGDPKKQGAYSASWTYIDSDDQMVPAAAGERAYRDTVYIATVTMTPDRANDILFNSEVKVSVSDNYYEDYAPVVLEENVRRNSADGSVTAVFRFPATSKGGRGEERPAAVKKNFSVGAWDLNLKDYDHDTPFAEYSVRPGTATITAPDVPDERFIQWNFGDTGVTLADTAGGQNGQTSENTLNSKTVTVNIPESLADGAVIRAEYTPVISKVELNLYDENGGLFKPEGGEEGPAAVEALVTISNTYEISPDNLEVTWSPDPGEDSGFSFNTMYEVSAGIRADQNGKVGIRIVDSGSEFRLVDPKFFIGDSLKVFCNGESDETVSFDADSLSVTKAYPDIKLKLASAGVIGLSDVSGIPSGASESDVKKALQQSVTVSLNDGSTRDVPVKWKTASPDKSADSTEEVTWTVEGNLDLPPDISSPVLIPVQAKVTMEEADAAMQPESSLPSGTYRADQLITLETGEAGGTIYYTTDGSDPVTDGVKYKEGQQIQVYREYLKPDENGVRTMTVRAYTKKAGKQNSNVVSYEYTFDNNISVPEGEQLIYNTGKQVGLSAGRFYTIEAVSKGVTINNNGDALASEPGTYKVRLKLTDPDLRWAVSQKEDKAALRSEESGAIRTTADDQIVSFTIAKHPLKAAVISGIVNRAYTGKARKQNPAVKTMDGAAKLVNGKDYKLTYKNNVKPGFATVTIKGIGKCTGSVSKTFKITVNCKLTSVKAKKGRKAKIRWKKSKKVSGYQIRYSTDKKFKKAVKKVNIGRASVTSKTIRKLKKGKTYYVQIRAVHKVKNTAGKKKTIYGKWSAAKKFKARK